MQSGSQLRYQKRSDRMLGSIALRFPRVALLGVAPGRFATGIVMGLLLMLSAQWAKRAAS
jgi:hypothetical protein